ncbi:10477_t:CDS:1 [Acaulospora colombiana]|uniref:10477_t:CDS:1 n=1 Tax=Acaulospora colombiana TaxID=27376 RepID=A0ACA9L905_9GLOM|nr:10477_t:CDS:1 [Acaulospora colombiana]
MNIQLLDSDHVIDFRRYYLYGFLLNLVPVYLFYPVRTAKTIQQSNIGTSSTTFLGKVFAERVKSEGFRGLYKGVGVYAIGSIGGRLVHFSTYDALRDRVYKGRGNTVGLGWLEGSSPTTINAFIGTFSALTTSSFMVPFDVVSQHLQVSKPPSPNTNNVTSLNNNNSSTSSAVPKRAISTTTSQIQHSFTPHNIKSLNSINNNSVLSSISSTKNLILNLKPKDVPLHHFLYRGWSASLLNTMSFYPAYFFTYSYTLEQIHRNKHHLSFLHSSHFLLSVSGGVAAGIIATLTSAPFDVVKTRIQIARKAGHGDLKWWNMASSIVKTEGFKGLFVGTSARMWIIVPLGSLNFWVFEKVRQWSIVKLNSEET